MQSIDRPAKDTALTKSGEVMSDVFAGDKTKARIVDAAEHLFAVQGFAATSIRQIAVAASANVAAVNYHFGSKDKLFEAVFARRVVPMNRERLARLDAVVAAARGGAPALTDVVDAFVRPPLSIGDPGVDGGMVQMQFLGRVLSMPDEDVFLNSYYGEVRSRFTAALAESCPQLPIATLLWRYNLMVGALIYAMAGPERMLRAPEGIEQPDVGISLDVEMTIREVVAFCVAGFAAGRPPP